jgi:hypothetical protein
MHARTAQGAAAVIHGYLRACVSEEGQKICRLARRTIGGLTHIAVVTPTSFDWVRGFEPNKL